MKSAMRRTVLASLVGGAMFASLSMVSVPAHASKDKPEIGFCIDDLRVERWSRDRDYFVAAATQLGAKVSVQSADASEERQISQIENLISRGMDVIVIVPFNGKAIVPVNNSNWAQLDDPKVNAAMESASKVTDPAARAKAWAGVDKLIVDAAPAIPEIWSSNALVKGSGVRGVLDAWNDDWNLSFSSVG